MTGRHPLRKLVLGYADMAKALRELGPEYGAAAEAYAMAGRRLDEFIVYIEVADNLAVAAGLDARRPQDFAGGVFG